MARERNETRPTTIHQTAPAGKDLLDLRTSLRLAAEVGARLGVGALLLRPLSGRQALAKVQAYPARWQLIFPHSMFVRIFILTK